MGLDNDNDGVQRDYLNAPDTAGRPMSLMSLILTFLLIAALALLSFIAGRWAYNAITENDSNNVADTSETATDQNGTEGDESTGDTSTTEGDSSADTNGGDTATDTESTEGDTTQGSTEDGNTEGDNGEIIPGDTADNSTGSTSGSTGGSGDSSIATTGPSDEVSSAAVVSEDLPNTGPESLLALFIGTVIVSTFAHKLFTGLKQNPAQPRTRSSDQN